jgi:hypothetical protein
MPGPASPWDEPVRPFYERALAALPPGVTWWDAHTHIGHNDPDGLEADPPDILGGLDDAGHHGALLFSLHEPDGYREANDTVIAAWPASGGRLVALGRTDPNADDAVQEARRCLDAGARGFKLHPRSDRFALPHPVVEEIVAVAHEARAPVLFHAGRGIPRLGETIVELARRYPGARFILAHAGISDIGWIGPAAAELDNLFFDTSWWQVGDLLTLYATVPPGRILYASDAPYGSGVFAAFAFLRCAGAVGLEGDALAGIAGGTLERILAGDAAPDLGPAAGLARLGDRDLGFERAASYLATAAQMMFRDIDPTEPLSLAALACERLDDNVVAGAILELIDTSFIQLGKAPNRLADAAYGALTGHLLAGTAAAGL